MSQPSSLLGKGIAECLQYRYVGRQGEAVIMRRDVWKVSVSDAEVTRRIPVVAEGPETTANARLALRALRANSLCALGGPGGLADMMQLYIPSEGGLVVFVDETLRLDGMFRCRIGPALVLHECQFAPSK